jgi:hypothetical protein
VAVGDLAGVESNTIVSHDERETIVLLAQAYLKPFTPGVPRSVLDRLLRDLIDRQLRSGIDSHLSYVTVRTNARL